MSRESASVATEKKEIVPFSIGYKELALDDSDAFADLLLQRSKICGSLTVNKTTTFNSTLYTPGSSENYSPADPKMLSISKSDHQIMFNTSDGSASVDKDGAGVLFFHKFRVSSDDQFDYSKRFLTSLSRSHQFMTETKELLDENLSLKQEINQLLDENLSLKEEMKQLFDEKQSSKLDIKQSSDEKVERETELSKQIVTPWTVCGKIDHEKVIKQFGCKKIDESLIDRVERLTSRRAHVFLRRGVFFAHRDLDRILDCYERGEQFYLYTGRGPSSESLHLGHLIPFLFTKYLQDAFKVPLVIQITDDEKKIWKKLKKEESKRLGRENVKDIIACGFDASNTFIFSSYAAVGGEFYENVVEVADCITVNKANSAFGFTGEVSTAKMIFPSVQAAPSFSSSFPLLFPGKKNIPCLIPCAIDQDPYFRLTRDVAGRLEFIKPALIESKFLPALRGNNGKMSASDANSAIYINDSAADLKKKINSAVSGGRDNKEDQKKYGANLKEDIPFQYLSFFLEDDAELEHIKKEYGEGRMLTGTVKKRLTQVLTEIVERHRRARAAVTEEMVSAFMAVRSLPKHV